MLSAGLIRSSLIGLAVTLPMTGCIIVVDGEDWHDGDRHDRYQHNRSSRAWTEIIPDDAIAATHALVIDSPVGDVSVERTDGRARIEARASGPRSSRLRAMDIAVTEIDGTLRIEPVWPDGRLNHESCDLTVHLPARDGVSIAATAGDVCVSGMGGPLDISTNAGDICVEDHDGPAAVSTSAGDISAVRVAGGVSARAVAGDIELFDVGWPVEAVTNAGDIEVALRPGFAGTINARTATGDVDLLGQEYDHEHGPAASLSVTLGDSDLVCDISTNTGDVAVSVLSEPR
jgi:hypothetical protein